MENGIAAEHSAAFRNMFISYEYSKVLTDDRRTVEENGAVIVPGK